VSIFLIITFAENITKKWFVFLTHSVVVYETTQPIIAKLIRSVEYCVKSLSENIQDRSGNRKPNSQYLTKFNGIRSILMPRKVIDQIKIVAIKWNFNSQHVKNILLNTQLMQYNNTKHINHNIKAIKDYHVHN